MEKTLLCILTLCFLAKCPWVFSWSFFFFFFFSHWICQGHDPSYPCASLLRLCSLSAPLQAEPLAIFLCLLALWQRLCHTSTELERSHSLIGGVECHLASRALRSLVVVPLSVLGSRYLEPARCEAIFVIPVD